MGWLDASTWDLGAVLGAASAVVAIMSAFFSWSAMKRQERRAGVQLRLAHDNDVLRWSDQAILILAEAHEDLCEKGVAFPDTDYRQKRLSSRAHISAMIDCGRLFFPNVDTGDQHGVNNEAGFRGHRQPALDALVKAYQVLGEAGLSPGPDTRSAQEINTIRRAFVAEVFKAIDPERRVTTLREVSS